MHRYTEGALPQDASTLPLEVDVTRVNNDDVTGLLATKIRVWIESAGGDAFYGGAVRVVSSLPIALESAWFQPFEPIK